MKKDKKHYATLGTLEALKWYRSVLYGTPLPSTTESYSVELVEVVFKDEKK